ncbi:MAG: hypothetical protein C6W54_08595 [Bacillaceae bacterium]|jgi:HSP20 family protein|uniref:Hsp20 family protein n=1 Tax=Aeribacillus composti TaxID=1868734 RepID=UPI000E39B1A1|nr:Hsp20 family protein [Aeribacillus composti]MED0745480.1 Hsp20 family protein [Aeribacillus composti]REJ24166.1 MAG: hypothetical protein C6W54_08595 [Bacillaceae bacterium]
MKKDKKEHDEFLPVFSQLDPLPGRFSQFFDPAYIQSLLKPFHDLFDAAMSLPFFHFDTHETDQEWVLEGKLPGVKKEQIRIESYDHVLTISIHQDQHIEQTNDEKQMTQMFKSHGKFAKSFYLPAYLDVQRIKASFQNEKLKIVIPSKKTKINID